MLYGNGIEWWHADRFTVLQKMEEKPSTERRNQMKSKSLFAAGVVAVAAVIIGIFAVSLEKREAISGVEGSMQDLGDPFVAIDLMRPQPEIPALTDTAPSPDLAMPLMLYDTISVNCSRVNCTAILNGKAVAGTDGGVFIYDPIDSSVELISADKGLVDYRVLSLLAEGDSLYIGTNTGLYVMNDISIVSPIAIGFPAGITAIARGGDDLYLGTSHNGVIRISDGRAAIVTDKQCITAIQYGDGLMWVASDGGGLFCYDGAEWRRRYLEDDSTAFDHVSSLGYRFDRLFAGTPEGMYVFDGGRWNLYDGDDGLLVCDVTSIAFMGWKILAGTRDWGYYEVFEDWVTPIAWSEGLRISSIASDGKLAVIGTPDSGIYAALGREVTNVNPGVNSIEVPIYVSLVL